jgi:hypothetical protein
MGKIRRKGGRRYSRREEIIAKSEFYDILDAYIDELIYK